MNERADISKIALVVVDMQNDFVHPDGEFAKRAKERPGNIDMPLLTATIPNVKKLIEAFRKAGRPVVFVAHIVKADRSDAAFPHAESNLRDQRPFITEGTWGSQIVDELAPKSGEHLVIKKGYNGFTNTPLDTILRGLRVNTCVVAGVTTCICISSTLRGGVEYNYRMLVVSDAVAERQKEMHDAELKILNHIVAEIKSTDEIITLLAR